jgi:hypothetical protein
MSEELGAPVPRAPHASIEITLPSEVIVLIRNLIGALDNQTRSMTKMAGEFTALQAQVAANTSAVQSAITLINGIADRIAAAGTDPTALASLTSELRAQDDALASAVTANTAAPAPSTISGGGGPAVDTTGGGTV